MLKCIFTYISYSSGTTVSQKEQDKTEIYDDTKMK